MVIFITGFVTCLLVEQLKFLHSFEYYFSCTEESVYRHCKQAAGNKPWLRMSLPMCFNSSFSCTLYMWPCKSWIHSTLKWNAYDLIRLKIATNLWLHPTNCVFRRAGNPGCMSLYDFFERFSSRHAPAALAYVQIVWCDVWYVVCRWCAGLRQQ